MLYCEKCRLKIRGNPNFCPLCQGALSGHPEDGGSYPALPKTRDEFMLAVRITLFFTVAAVVICGAVNCSMTKNFFGWWLYVAAGVISFWLVFAIAFRMCQNVTKTIVYTGFWCCVISFFWDLCTGYRGWSLDFVLPITCCVAMLGMAVIAKILNLHIEQYIYYLMIDIVFGIVPLVLLLCGVIRVVYPSVMCVAGSAISLTALLIFQRRALWAELCRRTHL